MLLLASVVVPLFAHAQTPFFERVSQAQARTAAPTKKAIPNAVTYRIDEAGLRKFLAGAPLESMAAAPLQFILPLPNGTTETFALRETKVLSPALAAENPSLKTYAGQGLTHRDYVIRLSLTSLGFDAIIWGVEGDAVHYSKTTPDPASHVYQAYFARDARLVVPKGFSSPLRCGSIGTTNIPTLPGLNLNTKGARLTTSALSLGSKVRTFRIAVATTGEWARNAIGFNGTQSAFEIRTGALALVATTINRINGIYERELSSRFVLVNPAINNGAGNIIFNDPNTDPYNNTDDEAQLNINQTTLDTRVGSANYDIGHLFGTGGGGVAAKASLCNNSAKAQGYSARDTQTGDPFVVDYVAHELGHQFGMDHTYNQSDPAKDPSGQPNACTTREGDAAYEVASGSTIMSYVGICNEGRNLQQFNDSNLPAFHIKSLTQAAENSLRAYHSPQDVVLRPAPTPYQPFQRDQPTSFPD